jgi:1-deoxy-D-xylulose-5-phosphate reductoisomerase
MKKILIFGSTGSVGRNALSVIKRGKDEFKVLGLCTNSDTQTLMRQIKEFNPSYVCVRSEEAAKKLPTSLKKKIKLFTGEKGLLEFSRLNSDISLMAISGISCLEPLLLNMKHTKRVALANKESLVTAGSLVFKTANKYNTEILPVDSEINALFQLIEDKKKDINSFSKVYLTASGGALAGYSKKDLAKVKVKKVLAHPTWKMGQRITVDCATLVNKGFEAIETHFFFGIPYEKIAIVIHKESIAHALVECSDNTLFACLYFPDMKMPISFALYYPKRFNPGKEANFKNNISLSFAPIQYNKYPLLKIILEAAKNEDNSLVILNACDEVAIDWFLTKKIKFTDIYKVMKYIFNRYPSHKVKEVDDVLYWDKWARAKTKEYLGRL